MMDRAAGALYAPLIERDIAAIPRAAHTYLRSHDLEELWIAIARFSVLGYAPSQHAKRAVVACRAAHAVRDVVSGWRDLILACARYAAESRQPWSEPPILDPPALDGSQRTDADELRDAVAAGDRARAERWLAARLDDAERDLETIARGDARLMLDTALALEKLLGTKGRYALLRMVIHELIADPQPEEPQEALDLLVDRAIEQRGAVDAVSAVFIRCAGLPSDARVRSAPPLSPYQLARDYAQTLIAHAFAPRLTHRASEFLAAVHDNLEHGESFADWSFA